MHPGHRRLIPPSHFLTLASSPVSLGTCWQLSALPRLGRLSFHTTDVTTLIQIVAVLVYGVYLFLTVPRGDEGDAEGKQINHADLGFDLWQGDGWYMIINYNPVVLVRLESRCVCKHRIAYPLLVTRFLTEEHLSVVDTLLMMSNCPTYSRRGHARGVWWEGVW